MRPYRFVDWASQAFLAAVIVLLLVFHRTAPAGWPWVILGHLVTMAGIHALVHADARGSRNPILGFLRAVYPLVLYTPFFRETELINRAIGAPRLDPLFLETDLRLFGTEPSVTLMHRFPQPWISELMYAAYFSYYIMIVGTGLWLWFRDRPVFRRYISVVSFVFYSCYFFYFWVPVIGPRLLFRTTPERDWYLARLPALPDLAIPPGVGRGLFHHLMAFVYRNFEAMSAAFPSSHVAVALTTLWFTWRLFPRLRWIHLIAVSLLCISTVYCRYHYAVDVPAGILAAMVLIPLGNALTRRVDGEVPANAICAPPDRG
ncbi:MAG: phosphatase PAP2 family protein [Verrucomicrobiales bacterium]|nr:phosphatase PAP2 family protein [Verrucomicrobiales bacterium]